MSERAVILHVGNALYSTVGASNGSFQKCFTTTAFSLYNHHGKEGKGAKEEEKTSFEENASKCNAPRALKNFPFDLRNRGMLCRIFSLSPFSAL